jgi:hypothetical protein
MKGDVYRRDSYRGMIAFHGSNKWLGSDLGKLMTITNKANMNLLETVISTLISISVSQ